MGRSSSRDPNPPKEAKGVGAAGEEEVTVFTGKFPTLQRTAPYQCPDEQPWLNPVDCKAHTKTKQKTCKSDEDLVWGGGRRLREGGEEVGTRMHYIKFSKKKLV